jgi:adenylate cyclase
MLLPTEGGFWMASTISRAIERFAYEPGETQEARSEKSAIFLVALTCTVAGGVWGVMYAVLFGLALVSFLPFLFVAIVGTSIAIAHLTKRYKIAVYSQIASIMLISAAIQWSMGGIFDSGMVIAWVLIGPLGALMFLSTRESFVWFALYGVIVLVTVLFDDYFAARGMDTSAELRRFFFGINLGLSSVIVFFFTGYVFRSMIRERTEANRLLLNVLPAQIAERLKRHEGIIADQYRAMSILFADAVDSTPIFADLEPKEVVEWLNEVFTAFDEVVERHGLEKLRTIGDGYMVGSGVPEPRDDHAPALVACALELIQVLDEIAPRNGRRMNFRFGINSGPAVAGIIGTSKFHYDVWGDAVNVASRMESTGEAGRIHLSEATYEAVEQRFDCVERGVISIKGKGEMRTFFVEGPRG